MKDIYRLQLLNTEGIGPVAFYYFLKTFGSAKNAINVFPRLMKTKKFKLAEKNIAEKIIENVWKFEQKIIWFDDKNYPAQLKNCGDAPPVLFYKGELKKTKNIAVVGTRNASLPAINLSKKLSNELAQKNYGIISGLAYGIDASAHSGAMKKNGYTIAVLAGSVENIYPLKNTKLYHEILEKNGAIISQHPPLTQPSAPRFPSRNRIIAGLSDITVVIEAKRKSGSLITAEFAKKYNRPVGAVPGFPTDERAGACNYLLKERGAFFIESIRDIESAMIKKSLQKNASLFEINEVSEEFFYDENFEKISEEKVLSLLSKTPIEISQLASHLGCNQKTIMPILLVLDLEKKAKLLPADFIIRL
ncbi:MAG: DNA-processing protein DprA [Alphaproteobacteria bacterium]|nr:MAG: DNA protecting protein DprA [Rickettsiaceae bacterium 4572_127]